jgi:hypothetical protein
VQGAQAPASSLHSKFAASPAANSKLGDASLLGSDGASVIVTCGATVSTVQEWEAAAPRLPAPSVARSAKLWPPSASPA